METRSNARRCNRLQGHLSTPLNTGGQPSEEVAGHRRSDRGSQRCKDDCCTYDGR